MIPEVRDTAALALRPDNYWNGAIADVNDHVVRMGIMTEAYFWHQHPNSDETFLVLEGTLEIAFEDGKLALSPGQMVTIPAGMVHCTRPLTARTVNLTVERADADTVRTEFH